jgi:hypothetical protein
MRLLSVAMWQSLVYCVITLALLGFGVSGAFLSVWRGAFRVRQEVLLSLGAIGFAVSNIVAMYFSSKLNVDAFEIAQDSRGILPLVAYYALLSVPYFFAGCVIGLVLARNPGQTTRLYCANMIGAGIGCIVFIFLIGPVGAPMLLVGVSAASAVSAALFAIPSWRRGAICSIAVLCVVALMSPVANRAFAPKVSKSKRLGERLATEPDLRIEFTRWTATGRVDVVSGPGLFFKNPRTGFTAPMKEIVTDGDAYTPLIKYPEDRAERFVPHDRLGLNAVYKLTASPRVLAIGLGGGKDVWEALGLGAREVDAVEFNPAIVHAVRNEFADFIGNPARDPRVKVILAEGRSYVRGLPPGGFDVLFMNGVDTFAALSSGAYTMAENYLYTVEAMGDYLRVLNDDGMISISRRAFRTPRETLRLAVVALQALRERGVAEPWRHLAMFVDYDWGTVLVKKSPFTAEDIAAIESLADDGWFGIAYRPGIEDLPASGSIISRYGTGVAEPAPYGGDINPAVAMVNHFKRGTQDRFYESYVYNVTPVLDDNPFFFRYYKWGNLVSRSGNRLVWNAAGGSLALVVLASLLIGAGVAVVVLMFLPLYLSTKMRGDLAITRRTLCFAVYFCALGIGFMFIEISLMQKFTLFLGHPTYSIAIVLSSMLVFSGIGSLCSGLVSTPHKKLIATSVAALGVIVILYAAGLGRLFSALLGLGTVARNLTGCAIIAPLAFIMGIPFPTGLRVVEKDAPAFVPWAWGVNGAAGVLASVAAIIVAMHTGFTVVLCAAVAVYFIGCAAIVYSLRSPGQNN